MKFTPLSIEGLVLIEPVLYKDNRGLFLEYFNQTEFRNHGIDFHFVQDNLSFSNKNVIRGLHFQDAPFEQGKLVSVVKGRVRDIAVDLRKNSITFGKHVAVDLDGMSKKMLWIPPGFAHGFSVFEEDTIFFYKCTNIYHKHSEKGIRYDDKVLNIDWGIDNPILSEKDKELMSFKEYY